MRKNALKILLLVFALMLSACPGDDSSDSTSIFSFDQTEEAFNKVQEANHKLREIKKLFRENESRQEDLKSALAAKDAAKVKEISDELIYQINDGQRLGGEAIKEIEDVLEMNVNEDFKEYLRLKADSLRKYSEAYEERRKLARLLRDSYDPKDAKQRDAVVAEFKRSDEVFKRIIAEAQETSEKANDFAKEVLSRKQEN